MKKDQKKVLKLTSDTIRALTASQLHGVGGGTGNETASNNTCNPRAHCYLA
jgi:hypothetical protein